VLGTTAEGIAWLSIFHYLSCKLIPFGLLHSFWLNPASVNLSAFENELPSTHPAKIRYNWMHGHGRKTPASDDAEAFPIPADTFMMSGFNGQNTYIIPSLQLVIARLGFTPDDPIGAVPKYEQGRMFGGIIQIVNEIEADNKNIDK
jgi:CubicO group peptidase (beta-lactamase class C family)